MVITGHSGGDEEPRDAEQHQHAHHQLGPGRSVVFDFLRPFHSGRLRVTDLGVFRILLQIHAVLPGMATKLLLKFALYLISKIHLHCWKLVLSGKITWIVSTKLKVLPDSLHRKDVSSAALASRFRPNKLVQDVSFLMCFRQKRERSAQHNVRGIVGG